MGEQSGGARGGGTVPRGSCRGRGRARSWRRALRLGAVLLVPALALRPGLAGGQPSVPATPPFSNLASPEAERNWNEIQAAEARLGAAFRAANVRPGDARHRRQLIDDVFLRPGVERLRRAFAVTIAPGTIAGVRTDDIRPATGIAPRHRHRVLINLHGGGMTHGGGLGGQSESIPIAAVGGFRVISIDYRMAPEHRFPAASEDVAAVYAALLSDYRPENIGIYGCSSGADLTAQAVAWFASHGLPRPGGIGMFGSGAAISDRFGDGYISALLFAGRPVADYSRMRFDEPYLEGADRSSPLVSPGHSPRTLAGFPPSLLITGTRDVAMSTTIHTHAQLVAAGVPARLHVWEGAAHCAFAQGVVDPDVPETRQAWDVITRFFDEQLGRRPRSRR